jgi:excinuclease ABC subunit C
VRALPRAPASAFVALAKAREELYVPSSMEPVSVSGGPCGPAMLLLRRCRDEAHAFAVWNHRRLRSRDYLRR